MDKTPQQLTSERKDTHGDWSVQSRLAADLKAVAHGEPGWDKLNHMQSEALDMILVKISRTISGDPNEPDHWDDIAGYAHLAKGGHE